MTDKMKALMFVYDRGSVPEKDVPEDLQKTLYYLSLYKSPQFVARGCAGPASDYYYSLTDEGKDEVQKYQEDQRKYKTTNSLVILGILVTLVCSFCSCFFGRG